MGLFKGIENVEDKSKKSEYFLEGSYLVELERVFEHKKQNGAAVFVAEMTVLESSNDKLPQGARTSFVETFKFRESGLARVKQLIVAAAGGGTKSEEVTEEVVNQVVSQENPLAKKKLRVVVKPGKDPTKKFLYHNFYPVK